MTLVCLVLVQLSRSKSKKSKIEEYSGAIPEIIENVISAIQSGLSLTEALITLKARGPHITRDLFGNFEEMIRSGESFQNAVEFLQQNFDNRAADQLFEALIFAHSLGSRELLSLLRQISSFTRQDLALREEIVSKQSWVRNSAHVAAAAPWILLVLLSLQPSTAVMYSTPAGLATLAAGFLCTVTAYLWMSYLARMPEPARVFGAKK